jgi:hypothetical protein
MNGAWLLPRTDEHAALLTQLADTVREQGGNALVLSVQELKRSDADSLVARFRADRGREYGEFSQRCRDFLDEIERETSKRKFTFAELEEIEDDFEKLETWLKKIRTRDFYPDKQSEGGSKTLEVCGAALRTFAHAVYAQEGVAPSDDEDIGAAEK